MDRKSKDALAGVGVMFLVMLAGLAAFLYLRQPLRDVVNGEYGELLRVLVVTLILFVMGLGTFLRFKQLP